eukprot:TRINITY_DN3851_c0_g2_i1.p1 TRINITY_DN3851_c0_g2~~TRINITY_DN3851_c0_g2_i1.p1  ORF type:complete len:330 (-),score=54.05 TRINITY_DN3851_c0_g2_i1:35-1024(-)
MPMIADASPFSGRGRGPYSRSREPHLYDRNPSDGPGNLLRMGAFGNVYSRPPPGSRTAEGDPPQDEQGQDERDRAPGEDWRGHRGGAYPINPFTPSLAWATNETRSDPVQAPSNLGPSGGLEGVEVSGDDALTSYRQNSSSDGLHSRVFALSDYDVSSSRMFRMEDDAERRDAYAHLSQLQSFISKDEADRVQAMRSSTLLDSSGPPSAVEGQLGHSGQPPYAPPYIPSLLASQSRLGSGSGFGLGSGLGLGFGLGSGFGSGSMNRPSFGSSSHAAKVHAVQKPNGPSGWTGHSSHHGIRKRTEPNRRALFIQELVISSLIDDDQKDFE